jgi:DNA-binding transcriptional LysR family regulator
MYDLSLFVHIRHYRHISFRFLKGRLRMDRLEAMSVLLTVVEQGTLSSAARKLGMPLTTVSRKLSDLEAQLGVRLFQRSNRKVTLTDVGMPYVVACKRILREVAEVEAAAAGAFRSVRGELNITAPVVFGRLHVLPVVIDFLQAYPDIDVRLSLADRFLHLQDEHVDLAVRIGVLPDSSLKALQVGNVRRVVCASPAYLAEHGVPLSPDDLAQHDCINFTALGATDSWTFSYGQNDRSVSFRSRLSLNTAEAAIDAAVAGLGVTRVLSYQIASQREHGTLQAVLEDFAPPAVPVSLVYDGQGELPLKLRAFVDFAGRQLRSRL